jgi:hypothetical protein
MLFLHSWQIVLAGYRTPDAPARPSAQLHNRLIALSRYVGRAPAGGRFASRLAIRVANAASVPMLLCMV